MNMLGVSILGNEKLGNNITAIQKVAEVFWKCKYAYTKTKSDNHEFGNKSWKDVSQK